jgi:hypothetical protein
MVFGRYLPRMVVNMQIQAIGNGELKAPAAARAAGQTTGTSKAAAAPAPQPSVVAIAVLEQKNVDVQQFLSMVAMMLKDMGTNASSSLDQTGANLNILA